MSKAAFLQCVLQAAILGFEVATKSSIVSKLKNLQCYGKTAMRDAISLGTKLLIEIKNYHNQVGMPNIWNFIHIVITDGEDTSSQINEFELMLQMGVVGQLIPSNLLKTIYIGVDLDHNSNAEEELNNLAEFGGSGAELKSITTHEMDQIFHKIVISLRQRISVEQLTIEANDNKLQMTRFQAKPEINLQLNRYLVLFTIDMSGSMEGKRHKKVVNAMDEIIQTLGDDDLVCGIVFNNECEILSKLDVNEWNTKYLKAKQQEQLVQQLTQIAIMQQFKALDYELQQYKQQEQQKQQYQQEQEKQYKLQQKQKNESEEKQKQQQFSQVTTIDPVIQKEGCCKCLIF